MDSLALGLCGGFRGDDDSALCRGTSQVGCGYFDAVFQVSGFPLCSTVWAQNFEGGVLMASNFNLC